VNSLALFTEIAAGEWHSIGLGIDGTVWTWGYNYYGQLGNGASGVNQNPTPAAVNLIVGVQQRQAC